MSTTFITELPTLASMAELEGPNTNQSTVFVLQPDQYQTNPGNGWTEFENRLTNQTKVTWISGYKGGQHRELRHGDTFTVTDPFEAAYLFNMYGIGNTVVNVPIDRRILRKL